MGAITSLRELTAAQLLQRLFPEAKYLWLTRRDKPRQAISYLLASSTNEWWAIEGVTPDKHEGSAGKPEFDPHAIASRERAFVEDDAKWRAFFEDNHITPLIIYHEDLVSDYTGTIIKVLKWLGVPNADAVYVPPTRLKQQSNARNEEWLARYEAFKSAGGSHVSRSGSGGSDIPSPERIERNFDTIPSAWRQWVAHSKLLKTDDDEIVRALTNNGYSRTAALEEVRKAAIDPYLLVDKI